MKYEANVKGNKNALKDSKRRNKIDYHFYLSETSNYFNRISSN